MLVAIMSDTHDNIWHLETALALAAEAGAEAIIHCGDFVAPFVLRQMGQAGIPVYGVLGNNDGSVRALSRAADQADAPLRLDDTVGKITLDGCRIVYTHLPEVAVAFAATGAFDLVCFGHSHTWHEETIDSCRLLNPGEIMGKNGDPGFALFDTRHRTIRRVTFPHAMGKSKEPHPSP